MISSPTIDLTLFQRNLRELRQYQPLLAEQLEQIRHDPEIQVLTSKSGHPVPVLKGKPLHSLENPLEEAESITQRLQAELYPQRLVFYGFGFGYHLLPLIQKGLSPIIVEPCPSLLKLALSSVDLTPILPHVTIHLDETHLPDLPRLTKVFTHPVMQELYPQKAQALSKKVISHRPPKTNDMEEGVYYSTYRNVTCLKNPCDLAIYQMLFFLVRPTVVLEIGTCRGGSALYFADLLRRMGGKRHIYTYDVVNDVAPEVLADPDITFSPGGWETFNPSVVRPDDRVLVIEDSSHTYENTLAVMRKFASYVTPNSYFIVEDGASGLTRPQFNGGPIRAIEEFLREDNRFEVDSYWENFYGKGNSNCLKGFLRRKIT